MEVCIEDVLWMVFSVVVFVKVDILYFSFFRCIVFLMVVLIIFCVISWLIVVIIVLWVIVWFDFVLIICRYFEFFFNSLLIFVVFVFC